MKRYKYFIGIDCGVDTGYAIWNAEDRRFLDVTSMKIHTAMDNIRMLEKEILAVTFIRVEDARQRNWIPAEKNLKQRVGRAKGAGSVSRDATIWEDFLKSIGANYEMVAPKNNRTKLNADAFKKLTGWPHLTNSHSRDAAMLIYGK